MLNGTYEVEVTKVVRHKGGDKLGHIEGIYKRNGQRVVVDYGIPYHKAVSLWSKRDHLVGRTLLVKAMIEDSDRNIAILKPIGVKKLGGKRNG